MKTKEKDDLTEEIGECLEAGYVLTQTFLGKGSYACVYLGWPTKHKVRSNFKLRAVQRNVAEVKVSAFGSGLLGPHRGWGGGVIGKLCQTR